MSKYYEPLPEGKDPELWEMAQRRVAFRSHLVTYIIIIGFLWVIWFWTSRYQGVAIYPWPIWPTFGWGIGLAFHYSAASRTSRAGMVEKEYEKLKNSRQ